MSGDADNADAATQAILRMAFVVDCYYQALRDCRLPEALIQEVVADWHRAMLENAQDGSEGVLEG